MDKSKEALTSSVRGLSPSVTGWPGCRRRGALRLACRIRPCSVVSRPTLLAVQALIERPMSKNLARSPVLLLGGSISEPNSQQFPRVPPAQQAAPGGGRRVAPREHPLQPQTGRSTTELLCHLSPDNDITFPK